MWRCSSLEYAAKDAERDAAFVDYRPNDVLTRQFIAALAYEFRVVLRGCRQAKRTITLALRQAEARGCAVKKI